MEIKVLFFASLKNLAGNSEAYVEIPEAYRVGDLKVLLGQRYPQLAPALGSALVAVNMEFAFDEDLIPVGAEVALFPPVSGGSGDTNESSAGKPTIFSITDQELDLDELLASITLPTTGAACLFTGMVRAETRRGEPRQTVYLEYEAYKPMAEAKMRQVAEEIRLRWLEVEGIAIVQRIGLLHPGTPTVLIACTAAHRDTGVFEAARYGIDRLKEIVPVWKKEVGPQGEIWVEGKYLPGKED
ncbi:MAG TPA: molybdenum cofactor biosynthesis protein MoaE [Anaerolineales bacterium]|nr:molybdenum cofactor biosynthesis protein MoaE [Anaerolineales bacterium]